VRAYPTLTLLLLIPTFLAAQSEPARTGPDSAPAPSAATSSHQGIKPPSIIGAGRPSRPPAGVHGRVVLEFVVDNTGLVDTTTIRTVAADAPALEPLARTDARNVRLSPGRKDRAPVRVMVRQVFRYQ